MDVYEIRLANGRYLATKEGGISKFASKIEKSQGQVSHIIGKNPIKPIGSSIAREIEKKCGKSHGWMDLVHPEVMGEGANSVKEESHQYSNNKAGSPVLTNIFTNINKLNDPELIKALDIYVTHLVSRQAQEKKQRKAKQR